MIAFNPNGEILFRRTPLAGSKTFPCHAKWLMKFAMSWVYVVPGATIAVPLASPLGISPTGLCVNRSSSCACDIFNISGAVTAICFLSFKALEGFQVFDQRVLV